MPEMSEVITAIAHERLRLLETACRHEEIWKTDLNMTFVRIEHLLLREKGAHPTATPSESEYSGRCSPSPIKVALGETLAQQPPELNHEERSFPPSPQFGAKEIFGALDVETHRFEHSPSELEAKHRNKINAALQAMEDVSGSADTSNSSSDAGASQELQLKDPDKDMGRQTTPFSHASMAQYNGNIGNKNRADQLVVTHAQSEAEAKLLRCGGTLRGSLDYIAGALVLLNSFIMLVEFELTGRGVGPTFGLEGYDKTQAVINTFVVIDMLFVLIFMVEIALRVYFERWAFVRDAANVFDAFLVMGGFVDIILGFIWTDTSNASRSVVLLRLMRALKSLRAVRMVRSLRFFQGLRVLVKACQCFLPSLCWAMVLLLIFMSMGALMMGNLLQDFVLDDTMDYEDRKWVWMRYGTAYRGMYTLFEITFAGNWPTSARPVLDKVSHYYVLFFVPYVTLVVFAVIRVISAVFLKDTLDAAQNDAEQLVGDRLRKKAQYVAKLESIFLAIDEGDGIISEERLNTILSNPKVAAYLETLELDLHESSALFHLLDNGDGEVTLDEFIDGIMRCKGPARAIDQVAMHADIKSLDYKLGKLSKKLMKQQKKAMTMFQSESHQQRTRRQRSKTSNLRVLRGNDSSMNFVDVYDRQYELNGLTNSRMLSK